MLNPLLTLKKIKSRMGKPIRPIVELQKDCSVVNVITTTVQTEGMINDTYQSNAWEVPANAKTTAVYVDGIFKGVGYFAGEEGVILDAMKDVRDEHGSTVRFSFKGEFGKLLDAALIERGSALKPSMMQTLVYCALFGGFCFMAGMSYS